MITAKQQKFIDRYKETNNGIESAISAGYSAKHAAIEANRLLKHPLILLELDKWRKEKKSQISKDDFVDMAIGDYKQLELTEANRPRFLDLAGKALGYIGANQDSRPNQTFNILNVDTSSMKRDDLLANVRRLLQDNSQ